MRRTLILTLALLLAFFHASTQEIAFTFDDAPMSDGPLFSALERSQKILAHLQNHKVKQAGFFVITSNITESNRALIENYVKAGHILGNHSPTHLSPSVVSARAYNRDVMKADSILKQVQGYAPFYRYPFLNEGRTVEKRDSMRATLSLLNLTNGYVTVDNYDWCLNGELRKAIQANKKVDFERLKKIYVDHVYESILFYDNIAKKHLGRSPAHVLLLHENDLAALFLGDLMQKLASNGWRFISPLAAYQDQIADQVPDVLFNGQGRVAAIASANGVPASELVQQSEDEDYLKRLLEDEKVFE